MKKIAVVLGTRPEAIKCGPVIRALQNDPRFEPVVISTGQHRQMLDETMASFGISTDIDLGVMAPRQTLTQITYRALNGLTDWLATGTVDALMVHGDTATTVASRGAGSNRASSPNWSKRCFHAIMNSRSNNELTCPQS